MEQLQHMPHQSERLGILTAQLMGNEYDNYMGCPGCDGDTENCATCDGAGRIVPPRLYPDEFEVKLLLLEAIWLPLKDEVILLNALRKVVVVKQ